MAQAKLEMFKMTSLTLSECNLNTTSIHSHEISSGSLENYTVVSRMYCVMNCCNSMTKSEVEDVKFKFSNLPL